MHADGNDRKLTILRLVHTVDPTTGGPIAGIRSISPVLASQGHVTDIASLDPAGAVTSLPAVPGVRQVRGFGRQGGGYGANADLVPWLREHARDYDAAIVHGLWQFHGRAALGGLAGRVPYFVFPHGMLDPWFRRAYPLKHLKKSLYWLLIERHVLRRARAVLFTCEEERLLARRTFWPYRCTERVVNYGAATPPPASAAQLEAFRASVPAWDGRPCWLFLGRLHPKKGVDLLVQAYARFARERGLGAGALPPLVVAGPEEDKDHVAAVKRALPPELQGAVHWPGMLQGDAKWGALRSAEVFVLPSHQENFGIAVVEALACGVPVLISEKVNIWREIVADGAGWAAPDDEEGTSRLLASWHRQLPAARAAAQAAAARSFAARFEISRAAASLVRTLGESSGPAEPEETAAPASGS